jgi:hypothetical protein
MSEEVTSITQLNLGEHSRNAGRDYHENRIPDSIKVYLATKSAAKLDEEAIDNERLFYYRFRMDVPTAVRRSIIDIKNRFGFTDHECRWLRRSGQLRVTRTEAKLRPDRLMPVVGWFYMFLLIMMCTVCTFAVLKAHVEAWRQGMAAIAVAGMFAGAMWGIDRVFLSPWRWLGHVGAR